MKENKPLGIEDLSCEAISEVLKTVAKEAIYETFYKSLFRNYHNILLEIRHEGSVRNFELASYLIPERPGLLSLQVSDRISKIIDELFYPCDFTYCHFVIYGIKPDPLIVRKSFQKDRYAPLPKFIRFLST